MALRNLSVNWTYPTGGSPVSTFKVTIKNSVGAVVNTSSSLASHIRSYTANGVDVGNVSGNLEYVVTASNNDGNTNSDPVNVSVVVAPPEKPVISSATATQ